MYTLLPLDQLALGQAGIVRSLSATGGLRRRLQDLGIVEGQRIFCLYRSLSGDPAAFGVCNTVFALRRCDACQIRVEAEGAERPWA